MYLKEFLDTILPFRIFSFFFALSSYRQLFTMTRTNHRRSESPVSGMLNKLHGQPESYDKK